MRKVCGRYAGRHAMSPYPELAVGWTLRLEAVSPTDLLATAQSRRLMVFAQDGRLVVRGPENAVPSLVQELLRRKTELMPLVPVLGPDERERFEERAAIAEYDGG